MELKNVGLMGRGYRKNGDLNYIFLKFDYFPCAYKAIINNVRINFITTEKPSYHPEICLIFSWNRYLLSF